MKPRTVCARCEPWSPDQESALNPKPKCWGKTTPWFSPRLYLHQLPRTRGPAEDGQ